MHNIHSTITYKFSFSLLYTGFVSIDALPFSLTSALTVDPPVFTLTYVSTGGPAT